MTNNWYKYRWKQVKNCRSPLYYLDGDVDPTVKCVIHPNETILIKGVHHDRLPVGYHKARFCPKCHYIDEKGFIRMKPIEKKKLKMSRTRPARNQEQESEDE